MIQCLETPVVDSSMKETFAVQANRKSFTFCEDNGMEQKSTMFSLFWYKLISETEKRIKSHFRRLGQKPQNRKTAKVSSIKVLGCSTSEPEVKQTQGRRVFTKCLTIHFNVNSHTIIEVCSFLDHPLDV